MPNPVKSVDVVPAQPLLDYIESLGGIGSVPGLGIEEEFDIEQPPYLRTRVNRTPEEAARYQRLKFVLTGLRGGATLSLFKADAICCDYLQVHPVVVFGPEWYSYGEPANDLTDRWVERWAAQPVERELVAA